MNRYRVSDEARSDLEDIWSYIARDNPEAADKFIFSIVSRFRRLASMPNMGRQREELAPRLRSFPVGRYVIFYRPSYNGVEIVRILHGARDLPPLFD
jgi:toxin ParE1/3/4